MFITKIISFTLLFFIAQSANALSSEQLLPPEQAFKATAEIIDAQRLKVSWQIADGYFLYQKKIKLQSDEAKITLEKPVLPTGESKHDEFFGEVIIYRNQLTVSTTYNNPKGLQQFKLTAHYQGCADVGVCYPPQKTSFNLTLPQVTATKPNAVQQLLKGVQGIKLSLFEDELLPPDQAFQFFAQQKDANTLHVNWLIAEGYYLYRDKIEITMADNSQIQLGQYSIPRGLPKYDEAFGQVEIIYHELAFDIPLIRSSQPAQKLTIKAKFQGCADRGVCYPPMDKAVEINLAETTEVALPLATAQAQAGPTLSEQDQIIQSLNHDSVWMTLISFFGFGLLLSFTPCVFPMIPILSGIIIGQNKTVTTRRAFFLSLSYVIASALTYTIFGILAAFFGGNLQASFQQPWIIILFSLVFIALSLSMFGFYHLELPKSFQAKLHDASEKHRDGSFWGAAIMGALSSLIVGPCVAAPLAGALIFIGQTGDAWLGGSALFMMGLGMGIPLLIIGTSAGKLLPKAGNWLNNTKVIFGVMMLAMAVWMLSRIIPASVSMFLWALLLIIPSIYLNALEPLTENSSGWNRLWKGTGLIMLIYGILLLIGLSSGNHNPLKPLENFTIQTAVASDNKIKFIPVSSVEDLNNKLTQAKTLNKAVMLDFYADWCISCKELEAYTFTDAKVKKQLNQMMVLKADVTNNTEQDQALLAKFNLIGPPAVLFFNGSQQEKKNLRVIGYQDAETFIQTLKRVSY